MRSLFEEVPNFRQIMQMIYGKRAVDDNGELRFDVLKDMAEVPQRINASKHGMKYMVIPTNARRTLNFYNNGKHRRKK